MEIENTPSNWMQKNYPLQRLQVTVQGRKDNTLADFAAALRTAADELDRGFSVSESFDDDFGYRFHVELSQNTICRLDASGFHGPKTNR